MADAAHAKTSFTSFLVTLVVLNVLLIIAATIYASRFDVPLSMAVPIGLAFLFQASVYLVPGFPQVRLAVESRFTRPELALLVSGVSTVPYLLYSIPTGIFTWLSFVTLLGYSLAISLLFVVAPPHPKRLAWQDAIVLALLAYPMVSGLSTMFQDIYRSPHDAIPTLDSLGRLMLMPLGVTAYLSLRGLKGTNFQFAFSRDELVVGVRQFLFFLPIGLSLAVGIGFAHWSPEPVDSWTYPFEVDGNTLAFYATVGLSEELFFRGIIQNLLTGSLKRPLLANFLASLLFGLVHITRGFPNWRWVAVAAVLGWFCGTAYAHRRSVVASNVTHTLVVIVQRFLFPRV